MPSRADDLADLRAGEVRVEQDHPRAELGGAEGRVEEAAVVAGQDRDAVAGPDAAGAQRVGDAVRAPVELLPADRAALVDDAVAVAVADGGGGEQAADRAVADEGAADADGPVREVRRQDPGAAQNRRGAGFEGDALSDGGGRGHRSRS